MNPTIDLFVTTFLKALMSGAAPTPILIDGEPCLLIHGEMTAILLIFADGEHLAQFLESVERGLADQAGASRIDVAMIHAPLGVITSPPGARIRPWWQTFKAGIYDGQLAAVRR
jgi:hypothetical protein